MAAELCPFDGHLIWANRCILQGSTVSGSQRASSIGDGAALFWWTVHRSNCISVMNLVATHHYCTSPLDYISHHALHTHIPVHHYTNYTAVTIHSLVLIASPHLHLIPTLTYKQHTYTHPLRSLVFPWLTFPSVFPSLSFRVLPGLLTSSPDRLLPASLTSPVYW